MKYAITHTTTYKYSFPVHQSYHVLHLTPAEVPLQSILSHRLTITPDPGTREDRLDYFGNPITLLAIEEDHDALIVSAESEIALMGWFAGDVNQGSSWESVAGDLVRQGNKARDVQQFVAASRHGRHIRILADYAADAFPPGCPVLKGANALMQRIFEDFTFDPSATDISTPVERVFEARRGVCQDFAHLMISALRSLGLPARYVSGYILTHPPEGQMKLQGADASHAWVSVWSPEHGWVDFDPTNNVIPNGEHVTIAYGRDYDDIAPISGVLLGGGAHEVEVAVDVVLLDVG